MSQLQQPNGDDHPEAARKHLEDARVLLARGRADGAAYLSGYVVECALKSIILLATANAIKGHSLKDLRLTARSVLWHPQAGAARYITNAVTGLSSSGIASGWETAMRYQAPHMTTSQANAWFTEAQDLYRATVYQMVLDGAI